MKTSQLTGPQAANRVRMELTARLYKAVSSGDFGDAIQTVGLLLQLDLLERAGAQGEKDQSAAHTQ